MKNIYKKRYLLSLLVIGSCSIQSVFAMQSMQGFTNSVRIQMTPKEIDTAAQNLITLVGLNSMAQIALVAYCTQGIQLNSTPENKSDIQAFKAIKDFKKEFARLAPSNVNTNDKIAEFSDRKYAVKSAFKMLGNDAKFQAILKKIAINHYKKHTVFYKERPATPIIDGDDLYKNIIAFINNGTIESDILNETAINELAIKASTDPKAIDGADQLDVRNFYQSVVSELFEAFGKRAPGPNFFAQHKVALTVVGVTALTAGAIYLALGKDRRDQIGRNIRWKAGEFRNAAGDLAERAGKGFNKFRENAAKKTEELYGRSRDWIKLTASRMSGKNQVKTGVYQPKITENPAGGVPIYK